MISRKDYEYIYIALDVLSETLPPIRSNYRVVALMTYMKKNNTVGYVVGVNMEPFFLGGSLCAEKNCLGKLREIKYEKLLTIYLISDSDEYITPGMSCREMLLNFMSDDTRLVLRSKNSEKEIRLGSLYPYVCIYTGMGRENIMHFINEFDITKEQVGVDHPLYELYLQTLEKTKEDRAEYCEIRIAAGVEFENGDIYTVAQKQTVEYCTTTDVVANIIPILSKYKKKNIYPKHIIQVDQFGILHFPFANGRSNIYESGYMDVNIWGHNKEGKIINANIDELCPDYFK